MKNKHLIPIETSIVLSNPDDSLHKSVLGLWRIVCFEYMLKILLVLQWKSHTCRTSVPTAYILFYFT